MRFQVLHRQRIESVNLRGHFRGHLRVHSRVHFREHFRERVRGSNFAVCVLCASLIIGNTQDLAEMLGSATPIRAAQANVIFPASFCCCLATCCFACSN